MKLSKKYLKTKTRKLSKLISKNRFEFLTIFLIVIASFMLGILSYKLISLRENQTAELSQVAEEKQPPKELVEIQNKVLKDKYVFKIKWGNLGKRMLEDGVIDKTKFAQAVSGNDKLPKELGKYLKKQKKMHHQLFL